jgi:hypothetical protein
MKNLPPGAMKFQQIIKEDHVRVDKTDLTAGPPPGLAGQIFFPRGKFSPQDPAVWPIHGFKRHRGNFQKRVLPV